MSTQQLTREEIARVFAMYSHSCILWSNIEWDFVSILFDEHTVGLKKIELPHMGVRYWQPITECKLLLTPLSRISDEDAWVCADISNGGNLSALKSRRIFSRRESDGFYFDFEFISILGDEAKEHSSIKIYDSQLGTDAWSYQYLICKGYAVPLWFAPNHPCNGLSAIELGIAIDNTQNK